VLGPPCAKPFAELHRVDDSPGFGGREKVRYEAPPAARLPDETTKFVN
jgi:hypothetical protein